LAPVEPCGAMNPMQPTFYVWRYDHPNDRVYVENILEFCGQRGVHAQIIELGSDGSYPELLECIQENSSGVLGFNGQLARSYVGFRSFLDLAERLHLPVIRNVTVGIGANRLSRIDEMSRAAFLNREINCVIPLLLKRIGGHLAEIQERIRAAAGTKKGRDQG
jgi:hypothetical protein